MSLSQLTPSSSFDGLGDSKGRVLFRGRARVFFALQSGTTQQTTYRNVGLLAGVELRAETVVRRDAQFREQARAVDVEVRIALLQNAQVERAVLALSNQLCKCKIRFEVEEVNENLIEREEIDFENIYLLPSDEIGIDFNSKISFRFVERMSWRKYIEKFRYGDRPTLILITPVNNAHVNASADVVFIWQAVATYDQYLLEIALDENFQNLIHESNTTTTSRSVALQKGVRYWWRVTAANDSDAVIVSQVRVLTTALDAPVFIPPTPNNNDTLSFVSLLQEFRVSRGTGNEAATEAEFEITKIGAEPQIILSPYNPSTGEAFFTKIFQSFSDEGAYTIRARSRNANVIGDWSLIRNFTAQVFRTLPSVLLFSSDKNLIATGDATVNPYQKIVFAFQVLSQDKFLGSLTVRLRRVRDSLIIQSYVFIPTSNPQIETYTETVFGSFIENGDEFFVEVENQNGQKVTSSNIQINTLDLPDVDNLHAQLTARANLINQNDTISVPTSTAPTSDNVVKRWLKNLGIEQSYALEQLNTAIQPILRLDGAGVPFVSFESNQTHLRQIASQVSTFVNSATGDADEFSVYVLAQVLSGYNEHLGSTIVSIAGNRWIYVSQFHASVAVRNDGPINTRDFSGMPQFSTRAVVFKLRKNESGSLRLTAGQHVGFIDTTAPFPTSTFPALSDSQHPNSTRLVLNGNSFRDDQVPIANNPAFSNLRIYEVLIYRNFHSDAVSKDIMRWLLTANLK